jgi:hypothetical protein
LVSRYVLQTCNTLSSNVSASLREIENRHEFLKNLSEANNSLDALEESVTRLEGRLVDVPDQDDGFEFEPFEVVKARLEAQVRQKRERLQALRKEERQAVFVFKTAKLVKPRLFTKSCETLDPARQSRIKKLMREDPGADTGDKAEDRQEAEVEQEEEQEEDEGEEEDEDNE